MCMSTKESPSIILNQDFKFKTCARSQNIKMCYNKPEFNKIAL